MDLKFLAVQQTLWIIAASMINAEDISAYTFPWVAGVVNNKGISLCSGCIVARHMVLTSSICLVKQTGIEGVAEKKLIVIAPADNPIVPRVVYITMLHPESEANKSVEHVGLLGVHPVFEDRPDLKYIAPIWDNSDSSLYGGYKYIVENAPTIQCYIVSWPYEGIGKVVRKHNEIIAQDYQINVVHVVPAHFLPERECLKHFLTECKTTSVAAARTCALILNAEARMCEYDRGAGLICANYLWGIAIGNHSCKKNDSFHEFIRIDAANDFIANKSNQAWLLKPSACQSVECLLRTVILGTLIACVGVWVH